MVGSGMFYSVSSIYLCTHFLKKRVTKSQFQHNIIVLTLYKYGLISDFHYQLNQTNDVFVYTITYTFVVVLYTHYYKYKIAKEKQKKD